jgi:hypothetical protein
MCVVKCIVRRVKNAASFRTHALRYDRPALERIHNASVSGRTVTHKERNVPCASPNASYVARRTRRPSVRTPYDRPNFSKLRRRGSCCPC